MATLISIISDHTFYKLTYIKLARCKMKISFMFHYVTDDVVIMWQMTWRWCFKNVALTWQPRGADIGATWC
jgi:hypothetical protein